MGRVHHRINHESGISGRALELVASTSFASKDYRLGDVSPYYGRVVDLGIFLACSWTPSGINWYRCLDSPGSVQFLSSLAVEFLSRGRYRTLRIDNENTRSHQ